MSRNCKTFKCEKCNYITLNVLVILKNILLKQCICCGIKSNTYTILLCNHIVCDKCYYKICSENIIKNILLYNNRYTSIDDLNFKWLIMLNRK